MTFATLNSKASCCSENDGVEKPQITSKMSVIVLEKAAPVTMINQECLNSGSKYKNAR